MGDKLDYKKEYKDLYMPKNKPGIVNVPVMRFIMADGRGDPNGNKYYEDSIELLYGLSFTIKMSKMKGMQPEGYFDYVVPPDPRKTEPSKLKTVLRHPVEYKR